MKLKYSFVLREVAGQMLAITVDTRPDEFQGTVTLSRSGAFIFEQLQQECTVEQLIDSLIQRYHLPRERAETDLAAFLDRLRADNLLSE